MTATPLPDSVRGPRDGVRNVHTTYLFTFFYWAARSILFQQVIAGFVFVLTGSNQPVGLVKGVQGISQLLFSFPAGYVADHTRRDRVLRLAGVLGVLGSVLTGIAVWTCTLGLLNGAFAVWGLFAAFQSPAMEAIFAESVPHGRRSYPFMIKYNVSNVAMVVGPLLSVLLFLYVGDNWRVSELQPVLLCGCGLAAVASLILFRFNDDHSLREGDDEDDELVHVHGNVNGVAVRGGSPSRRSVDNEPLRTPSVVGNDLEIEYDYSDHNGNDNDNDDDDDDITTNFNPEPLAIATEASSLLGGSNVAPVVLRHDAAGLHKRLSSVHQRSSTSGTPDTTFLCLRAHDHVPLLIFASDFIISNGAGMTVYFFPLFFKQEYGLSPIHVSLLFLLQPLVVMVLSVVAQRLSSTAGIGRMPIIVSTRFAATLCLLGMSFAEPLALQVVLFLVRGGMMRCSQPLRRSVLMDFVKKEVRARWNALEGISVFSYSGSAVLGGYLVDLYDYRTCFFITSFVYFLGLSLELFLLPLTKHAIEK